MAVMTGQYALLLLVLFSSVISGFAIGNSGAVATAGSKSSNIFAQLSIPEPTEASRPQELRRRQESQRTLIAAPDNTCGYFGGSSVSPWGCSTGNCVFATPTASANVTQSVGSVLCCDPSTGCPSAPAPTACVDKGRYDYSTACTGTCSDDPMTLKCRGNGADETLCHSTSGIYLFCNTLTFPTPSISALFCNYLSTYDVLTASTSYVGQTDHAFTPTTAHFAVSTTPSSTVSSSSGTAKSFSSTKSIGTPSATAAPSSGGSKKTNKGAIIGGVIGGVVGLALIIAAVIFFLRWRNTPYPEEKTVTPPGEPEGNSVVVQAGK